ncbi:hypothetical protein lerEdw1_020495 [Lerista edwardsae]|nr:hypothetical protein lerEdw1_020495 [Lerista edwardsae]
MSSTPWMEECVYRLLPDSLEEKESRKPPSKKQKELYVPRKIEPPVLGVQSKKNFIAANAAEAIMSVPKKPLRACVDMRHGDKFLIEDSGMVKKYLHKKDFGAVPRYLVKHNQDVQRAQEEADARVQEVVRQKHPKRISRDEREALLEGLKKNWEEINREFQGLSVVTDTIPKRLHKEKLEVEMKQLEHDIKAIEKHCFIYVAQE